MKVEHKSYLPLQSVNRSSSQTCVFYTETLD